MNVSKILKKIKGCKFHEIFKQLDWIIINFCDPVKYSLHIASAVRICHKNKIIFNVSDEFFTKDCIQKSEKDFERLAEQGITYDPDNLLIYNSRKVNNILHGKCPKKIRVSRWKDVVIRFSDKIEIQIMQDCLGQEYEYYRFIEYDPYYKDDSSQYSSKHYIVYNDQGEPKVRME